MISVFIYVGPVQGAQVDIPDWKNPIVNAAIDQEMLVAAGVRSYDIEVNGEPATIYTNLKGGDKITLLPKG